MNTNDIENALEEELAMPKYFLLVDDFTQSCFILDMPTMNIEIPKLKQHSTSRMIVTNKKKQKTSDINW